MPKSKKRSKLVSTLARTAGKFTRKAESAADEGPAPGLDNDALPELEDPTDSSDDEGDLGDIDDSGNELWWSDAESTAFKCRPPQRLDTVPTRAKTRAEPALRRQRSNAEIAFAGPKDKTGVA